MKKTPLRIPSLRKIVAARQRLAQYKPLTPVVSLPSK
jgi:hypothetical protein